MRPYIRSTTRGSHERCGICAKQLECELGVTYKTAFRMARLIRTELMRQDDAIFSGPVEADETYVGGKRRKDRDAVVTGRPGPNSPRKSADVCGDVHTKHHRGLLVAGEAWARRVYHSVAAKHLDGYLNEYVWRYNHREDERGQFRALLPRAVLPRV